MGGLDVDHAFDDCSSRRPVKAAPRNPAACAATCLPTRAGVPPTATWRVQPERTLRLFLPVAPCGRCCEAGWTV